MAMGFPIIPLFGLLIEVAAVLGIIYGVRYIVKEYKQTKANGDQTAKRWYKIIIIFVIIAIASWILNMGWFRVFLTWIALPFIHTVAFLLINMKSANRVSSYKKLKKYMILSCMTYLLPYLLFPDGGDGGGMYLFFTLIRNDTVANVMMYIAPIIFVVNIAVLILEYFELKKCKSQS